MAEAPSSNLHCNKDSWSALTNNERPSWMKARLEAGETVRFVRYFARQAASLSVLLEDEQLVGRPKDIIFLRHLAAIACARTIVAGECPLFTYVLQDEATTARIVLRTPEDLDPTTLHSVSP